jgi:hypothetical protein
MKARCLVSRLVLLLLACGAAAGADRDFDRVVKAIETHYGTRHANVPLMGVANFFVKVARPAGTTSFHLAVFDHLSSSAEDRDEFMDQLDSGKLHPLVKVRSTREGAAATYILAADAGKSTRMLIAAFSENEGTIVQVTVNAAALRRTIEHPEKMAKALLGKHDDR